jgi:uncharacterized protein YjbJ (UPF0337 family)
MNWDEVKGNWTQLKGKAKTRWGEITDDRWTQIEGRRDQMVGVIQEEYGRTREEAEREVDEWQRGL